MHRSRPPASDPVRPRSGPPGGVERVAITPALRAVPDLPEALAAQERGLPVVTWQAVLGELMAAEGRIGLAVTGTHGKSTTTACSATC